MKFKQGDVVMVNHPLPDGTVKSHPFVIISCSLANSKENYYTGVMMSSTSHTDIFSMDLDDTMFERPLKPGSQIRLYIIVSFPEAKVNNIMNVMNKKHLKHLLKQIHEFVLCPDS